VLRSECGRLLHGRGDVEIEAVTLLALVEEKHAVARLRRLGRVREPAAQRARILVVEDDRRRPAP